MIALDETMGTRSMLDQRSDETHGGGLAEMRSVVERLPARCGYCRRLRRGLARTESLSINASAPKKWGCVVNNPRTRLRGS